jgi:hypothetical protein
MSRSRIDKRRQGSTLLIVTVILILLALLGFTGLETVSQDQQVAHLQKRKKLSLYAAEAGVATALETLVTNSGSTIGTTTLSDGTAHPAGQPRFRPDPSVADPIESLGTGAYGGMGLNIGQGGTATYQLSYWRIRVQGEGPGGSITRLEAVTGSLLAN